jgi:parallel beta-helix repeat protein
VYLSENSQISNISTTDCEFGVCVQYSSHSRVFNLTSSSTTIPVYARDSSYLSLLDSTIDGGKYGVLLYTVNDSTVSNTTIQSCEKHGIIAEVHSTNLTLTHNTIHSCPYGIHMDTVSNSFVRHNTVFNDTHSGIYGAYLNNVFIENNTGYENNFTIWTRVSSGIVVRDNIASSCRIYSYQVSFDDHGLFENNTGSEGLLLAFSDSTRITNNTLQGLYGIVAYNTTSSIIQNNSISAKFGVVVTNTTFWSNVKLLNLKMKKIKVKGLKKDLKEQLVLMYELGITRPYFTNKSGAVEPPGFYNLPDHNIVVGNTISGDIGVVVTGVENNVVGNRVDAKMGVVVQSVPESRAFNNSIRDNEISANSGIVIAGLTEERLTNCHIQNNSLDTKLGITVWRNAQTEISNNFIQSTKFGTVVIGDVGTPFAYVVHNRYEGFSGALIFKRHGCELHYNDFGNTSVGVWGITPQKVNAEYNWWGSPKGPSPRASRAVGNVDYKPWLETPP